MGRKLGSGPIGYLSRTRPAARFTDRMATRIADLLRRSSLTGNPKAIAANSLATAIWAAFITVPSAIVASFILSPYFAFAMALPLAFVAAPELRLRDAVAQRKEGIERELPFFSMFASILGGAGVPLYSALGSLGESDAFASMKREALLAKRDVEVFGMDPNDALERIASNHPSRRFCEFLLGYTSKARSGGDVPSYLSDEGGAQLKGLEDEWGRYVSRIGIVGTMMITVFGVVPLLLMVVGVFSPGYSTVGLLIFSGLGIPLFTAALLLMSGRMQPVKEAKPGGRLLMSTVASLPLLALGLLAGEAWVGAAATLLVFFVLYGYSVREDLAEVKDVDDGLGRFLRDLLEYKRQEYDLGKAVVAIAAKNTYNPRFDRLLSKAASQLRGGVPLEELKIESGSGLCRIVFLLIGEMSRTGGGTVETVFQVSSFASRMTAMRRNTESEMKPYLILSYVSTPLLAFGVSFVGGVLSSLGSGLAPGLASLGARGTQIGGTGAAFSQVSDLLIVLSAASLGLVGAKIADFTARNTFRAAVNVAVAVAAILLMAVLSSHSLLNP